MNKQEPFVIERTYDAPIEKVWDAITSSEAMKQWYFDLPEFRAEVGFQFSFTGGSDCGSYLHLCKVTKVVPGKLIAYTWRYDNYPGNSEVTFELFDEGGTTRLKLTHEGLESFPQDTKDFRRESFAEGWTMIIGTLLKNFVEKGVAAEQ